MIRDVLAVPADLTLRELVDDYVLSRGYRGFPVVDGSGVRGLISVADIRAVPRERWGDVRVSEAMRRLTPGLSIGPATPLVEALGRIAASGGRLVVLDGGRLVGLLTKDGLNRFVELRRLVDGEGARAA
jgi:CBS domain-containing protein